MRLEGWTPEHVYAVGRGVRPRLPTGWLWPHPYGWWRTGACFGHAGNFNGNRPASKLLTRFAGLGSGLRVACVD